ncbi:4-(cytidine 5'-diphospho)-2-C-methyl-D-erythritol kinase [Granulicella sp. S156]|jgi:4-diphosphocytidyl-2-C-methyl-D-erythritol kinase|uniref:4-(cytidine 5'-diphospho)-2-C-methyl-D-erythritol kinase n=1 Tax=Granulicella sp. S156 TaxID=1747224 RepID=UPI00131DE92D|nr:4-(cytidine 5'-diphospho)-2-C-methyl-D-erythritol kinase [Granulicella sp. S156]
MSTRVRSFSKINLGLAVGPARADGFHGLATMYQTLALHDFVTVSARASSSTTIRLTADHRAVPTDARNTAWKMVEGALARMGVVAEVEIDIQKRLPVQGGMGAGSANAVAALLGLERELGKALPGPERLDLAAEVGSDVPLFLLGGSVLGLGRGEEVYPLPDLPATLCVVAIPSVGVSTAQAFRDLDARSERLGTSAESGPALTFQQPPDKLSELSRVLAAIWTTDGVDPGLSGITRRTSDLAENPLLTLVRTGIENDFEEVAFSQHPSLRSTKRELMGTDSGGSALYAALSGSGSALFGLYGSQADARAAQQRVQQSGTQAILTETLPRAAYWDTMFAE